MYNFAHGISSLSGAGKNLITAKPLPDLSSSGFQRRSSPPPPELFTFSTSLTNLAVSELSLTASLDLRKTFGLPRIKLDLACGILL